VVTDEVHQRTMERIIWPTVKGMAAEGNTYTGFLYAGLMIDKQGNPKVIEFNCRFGDPETQPIMLRMKSDLVDLCLAACDGKLDEKTSDWDERASLGVVIAAGGYPGNYNTGDEIHGLPLEEVDGARSSTPARSWPMMIAFSPTAVACCAPLRWVIPLPTPRSVHTH
jgi:phosphoribosylamine--glycine ligase